jgi:hypothetical protein
MSAVCPLATDQAACGAVPTTDNNFCTVSPLVLCTAVSSHIAFQVNHGTGDTAALSNPTSTRRARSLLHHRKAAIVRMKRDRTRSTPR